MRRLNHVIPIVLGCVLLACAPAYRADDAANPERTIREMAFLAGTWSGSEGAFTAYYSTPEGGRVLSYSELRRDGEVAFHEFELFQIEGDTVVFNAYPGGKPATPMPLASIEPDARRVTFEKPDKDFPTRIAYHRVSDDRLVITLSDPHNAPDEKQVFELKRVAP